MDVHIYVSFKTCGFCRTLESSKDKIAFVVSQLIILSAIQQHSLKLL